MTADVDLLVVGGGPVGLGTALLARGAGLTVAVVEQRADPVDKACGEGLMPGALRALRELGVDPSGVDFHGIRYLQAAGTRSAQARFRQGPGRGVRRTTLHAALADAADAAGVQRVRARVDRVCPVGGGVVAAGVRGRYLVAADGLHSTVTRQLGLDRAGRARRPRWGLRRHVTARPWTDHVEVHWADEAEAYVTPVADDLVGVAVLTDRRGRTFEEWMTHFPRLTSQLGDPTGWGAASSRLLGAGPLEHVVARRVAGRVLLVGDAAGYVDALTGEGVAVGLACARVLVDAVVRDDPQSYERAWRAASRRYRVLTRGILLAAQRRPLRAAVVPSARALPRVFAGIVDRLA